ncbi:hypothetical protein WMF34_21070 [Sorangium sp. So ce145]
MIARVRDHAPDTGQHLVAPRAELRGDLAIRERHGEVDPREPGARRGVDVALRHPTPRYRLSALEGLADRRHGLHLDRPHHRDARLDLVDPGPLEHARDLDLLRGVKATPGACSPSRRVLSFTTPGGRSLRRITILSSAASRSAQA